MYFLAFFKKINAILFETSLFFLQLSAILSWEITFFEEIMAFTKIISTLGPASYTQNSITSLIEAGVDIFRINMSHGSHENALLYLNNIREASLSLKKHIPVFMDLRGPKIRIGVIDGDTCELEDGNNISITTDVIVGNSQKISTDYMHITSQLKNGDTILLDDGKIVLNVIKVEENDVFCIVRSGGTLRSRKGLMLPGKEILLPALSEKDIADAKFGIQSGIDGFMLSFVQKPDDIYELHNIMKSSGAALPVISKIESAKGIEHLESITRASDGILVARGDLGVELPVWELPPVQEHIINIAQSEKKPVIVATEMLESMISNSRPTRAEVSDVATAVTEGADAVMLSGETAIGKYPVQAVNIMDRTLGQAEKLMKKPARTIDPQSDHLVADSVSFSAVELSRNLKTKAIVLYSKTGFTARTVSHFAPSVPIYVFTSDVHTARICNIYRGTETFLLENEPENFESFLEEISTTLLTKELARPGDTIIAANVTGRNSNSSHANSVKVFIC